MKNNRALYQQYIIKQIRQILFTDETAKIKLITSYNKETKDLINKLKSNDTTLFNKNIWFEDDYFMTK